MQNDHSSHHTVDASSGPEEGAAASEFPSGHAWLFMFTSSVTLLFKEWTTNSETFIPTCFGVALLAVFHEGLKTFRGYLAMKTLLTQKSKIRCCSMPCTLLHLIQTVLHAVQVTVSYLLMLIVMTLNAWICISILLGATFGYLIFGWTIFGKQLFTGFDVCH